MAGIDMINAASPRYGTQRLRAWEARFEESDVHHQNSLENVQISMCMRHIDDDR